MSLHEIHPPGCQFLDGCVSRQLQEGSLLLCQGIGVGGGRQSQFFSTARQSLRLHMQFVGKLGDRRRRLSRVGIGAGYRESGTPLSDSRAATIDRRLAGRRSALRSDDVERRQAPNQISRVASLAFGSFPRRDKSFTLEPAVSARVFEDGHIDRRVACCAAPRLSSGAVASLQSSRAHALTSHSPTRTKCRSRFPPASRFSGRA